MKGKTEEKEEREDVEEEEEREDVEEEQLKTGGFVHKLSPRTRTLFEFQRSRI